MPANQPGARQLSEPADYLAVFRRRLAILVATTVAGLLVALLITPGSSGSDVRFRATATLLVDAPQSAQPGTATQVELGRAAVMVTAGEVPRRVADRLGSGSAAELASRVSVSHDVESGVLRISSVDGDGATAARLSNAFAEELIAALEGQQATAHQEEVAAARDRADQLKERVAEVDRSVPQQPGPERDVALAERDALINQYRLAYDRWQQLATGPRGAGFTLLERAEPVPESALRIPTSRAARMAITGLVGLLLGAGLALLIDRVDDRIHTKEEAEEAFGAPVIAEVPRVPTDQREQIAVAENPISAAAEAYRVLRRHVLSPTAPGEGGGVPEPRPVQDRFSPPGRIVLVTSPGPREGKTTTAGNLAAAIAETGASALLLDFDIRRPTLHKLMDVPMGPGVAELIANGKVDQLAKSVRPTSHPGVSMVTSGNYKVSVDRSPPSVVGTGRSLIQVSRRMADVVVIDTPAMLVVSDAGDLLDFADAVLVVARVGRTTMATAARTSEMLRRSGAPVLGIVLLEAPRSRVARQALDHYQRASERGTSEKSPPPKEARKEEPDAPEPPADSELARRRARRTLGKPDAATPPTAVPPARPADQGQLPQ